ncbi:DUF7927 domain-containing protein [Streptomyces omiyaensis]|uniref:DUF7927 domain-containing protein n=1 Tax=Streptomyces omiyaensis TaxID=68247 RepID=UPI0036F8D9C7
MYIVPSRPARAARALAAGLLAAGTLSLTAAGPAAADVVEPFGQRYQESLYGDFTTLGNTVMGCPAAPAGLAARCAAATRGEGGDSAGTFVMRRLDTDGTGRAYGSSTGRITLPEGAEVAHARLHWGGHDGTYRSPGGARLRRCDPSGADVERSPGDPATTSPLLSVGAGPAAPVSIDSMVVDPPDTAGPHHYTGESDVTAAFEGVSGTGAPLTVGVGGVWAPDGRGCAAGWSLTVVHRLPDPGPSEATERRSVHLHGGHVLQRPASPATTVTVEGFRRAPGKARVGVTAYAGDRNTPGDTFLVDGRRAGTRADGTGDLLAGEDGGAPSPGLADGLSPDAKELAVPEGAVPVGATSAALAFSAGDDAYLASGLAFSVPVADLEVTRTASPRTARPGDTVTYTVTARNVSGRAYPGASFTDDPTGALDDAVHGGDAEADLGTVAYDGPRIRWTGDIPAGRTATVTYSVRVRGPRDPAPGDGELRGTVEVGSPRSNCGRGSEDPACTAASALAAPAAPPAGPDRPAPSPSVTAPPPPATTSPAPPAPGPGPGSAGGRGGGSMAGTGGGGERLWLLGALAVVLAATGLVAKAALRGRRTR